jgi:hypothetical protein
MELLSQFVEACHVGGKAEVKRMRTRSGVKDTFQSVFLERLFTISTKQGKPKAQKESDMAAARQKFPADITSPVWHIKSL